MNQRTDCFPLSHVTKHPEKDLDLLTLVPSTQPTAIVLSTEGTGRPALPTKMGMGAFSLLRGLKNENFLCKHDCETQVCNFAFAIEWPTLVGPKK